MDLRIVNTCNNDCLYCLEQSLRKKEKYINKYIIFNKLLKNPIKVNLTFFGGNPLLHPDIIEIFDFAKKIGYKNIGILTNTYYLEKSLLKYLKLKGLNNIGIYFNTFNSKKHIMIVGKRGIKLGSIIKNILLLNKMGVNIKIIIHINKQNIKSIYKDIIILNKKYFIKNFEFINYFPFDRPYNKFRNILEYDFESNREYLNNLFKIIRLLHLKVKFMKFSRSFFGDYIEFFNLKMGILKQIGIEDYNKINSRKVFYCKKENRCRNCFLKEVCNSIYS